MRRFAFSLEKVLELREFERKQAETELGKAVATEAELQHALELVAGQRVRTVHAADAMHDLTSLYNAQRYFMLLDQRKEMLLEELSQAHLVTEEKRDVMREALKRQKVLEQLREKRHAAWRKDAQRAEEAAVDDITTGAAVARTNHTESAHLLP